MAAGAPAAAPVAAEAAPADGSGTTALDLKIAELVKAKEAEAAKNPSKVHAFNRILLKFPFIRKTLRSIKRVFDEFDAVSAGGTHHATPCVTPLPVGNSGQEWYH